MKLPRVIALLPFLLLPWITLALGEEHVDEVVADDGGVKDVIDVTKVEAEDSIVGDAEVSGPGWHCWVDD